MLSLYIKFSNRSKHMKIVAENFIIPRNISLAILQSPLFIQIRLSDDISSRTFY